ncbi:GIY-YIG nuclease family protein [Xanthomonas arboricola pv. corylina]|uniref:GIY-YIG nuclease family protein n=1 Tax=Xanthomonas arboricola TaxID=56448 RepID=A0A2S7ADH8_9XANT|nr:GIY-YIG nuclease family protein [Xanthomonas arboricola]PPU07798.1 hypothetical protein XarjCFBP7645_09345 [Xanthomonas arboricola]PPU60027.1 hypothetical protein XacyCFBP1159_13280 [Xanthomonas arboricola pv. corylina]
MSMINMRRELRLITHSIHALFVYAACTEDGYVKVGISRTPFDRIYDIHCNSPSPVRAAQWVWVGSKQWAMRIEKMVCSEWTHRRTRGEWYWFDYANPTDKQEFHDTLSAVVEVVTKKRPEWNRLGPQKVQELILAGNKVAQQKKDQARGA